MPEIHFSDIGEVDLDDLECYEVKELSRTSFSDGLGEITAERDRAILRFRDGREEETSDPSGIHQLRRTDVKRC